MLVQLDLSMFYDSNDNLAVESFCQQILEGSPETQPVMFEGIKGILLSNNSRRGSPFMVLVFYLQYQVEHCLLLQGNSIYYLSPQPPTNVLTFRCIPNEVHIVKDLKLTFTYVMFVFLHSRYLRRTASGSIHLPANFIIYLKN